MAASKKKRTSARAAVVVVLCLVLVCVVAAAGALVEALRLHETDTQQMNGAQTPEEAKHEE